MEKKVYNIDEVVESLLEDPRQEFGNGTLIISVDYVYDGMPGPAAKVVGSKKYSPLTDIVFAGLIIENEPIFWRISRNHESYIANIYDLTEDFRKIREEHSRKKLYSITEVMDSLFDDEPRRIFGTSNYTLYIGYCLGGYHGLCYYDIRTGGLLPIINGDFNKILLNDDKIYELIYESSKMLIDKSILVDARDYMKKLRGENTIKMETFKTISLNNLVKRQTKESQYSHYEGSWESLVQLVRDNFDNGHQGYRDGVWIVPLPPFSFYSSMCKLDENSELSTKYIARQEGEDKVPVTTVLNGKKTEAKFANAILYRHDILEENNENSTNAEWEVISINAMLKEDEPLTPITMARNFLHERGGTKAVFTAEQFAESIWYWKDYAMYEPKPIVVNIKHDSVFIDDSESSKELPERLQRIFDRIDPKDRQLSECISVNKILKNMNHNEICDILSKTTFPHDKYTMEFFKSIADVMCPEYIGEFIENLRKYYNETHDVLCKDMPKVPYVHYPYKEDFVSNYLTENVQLPAISAIEPHITSASEWKSGELDILFQPLQFSSEVVHARTKELSEIVEKNIFKELDIKSSEIKMPDDVNFILERLHNTGIFEGYVVGGCVRDSMLGLEPKDWDICTNAHPDDVIDLFKDFTVIPTGLKHGTVTVRINDVNYEITTFRTDGKYSDGRHPDEVIFSSDIKDDLSRRDFTMNAIAFSPYTGIIDPFHGINAIKRKSIICVGNGVDRFNEDGLRVLRAFRFAATLDFNLNDSILAEISLAKDNLKNISKERIREEFNKIITSNNLKPLRTMYELDVLKYVIDEFTMDNEILQNNPHHHLTLFGHTFASVEATENDLVLRLTMLLHDIGKLKTKVDDDQGVSHFYGHADASVTMAKVILTNLKYDNKTIHDVTKLIEYHDYPLQSSKSIKKVLNVLGEDLMLKLMSVRRADISAQSPTYYCDKLKALQFTVILLKNILKNEDAFSIKHLKINGKDLIKEGYPEGRFLGYILKTLLKEVVENDLSNEYCVLLKYAKEHFKLKE